MSVSVPEFSEKDIMRMFSIHKLMHNEGNRNNGGFCI